MQQFTPWERQVYQVRLCPGGMGKLSAWASVAGGTGCKARLSEGKVALELPVQPRLDLGQALAAWWHSCCSARCWGTARASPLCVVSAVWETQFCCRELGPRGHSVTGLTLCKDPAIRDVKS